MQADKHNDSQTSFLEEYMKEVSPKLKEIDLIIKLTENQLSLEDTASMLSLSSEEIKDILQREKISQIDKQTFFKIMENGSSFICQLFKRELDCGSPYIYTQENISYIYNIEMNEVSKACENLKMKEITSYTMPILFSHIPGSELKNFNKTLR